MKNRYEFDRDFNLRRVTHSVGSIIMTCLKWVIATASLAALYYIIFSLLINTDEERRLKRENKMYEKLYPEMQEKAHLIADVIKDLQRRDDAIYEQIFHSSAPPVDPGNPTMFDFGRDSTEGKDLIEYTEKKAGILESVVRRGDSTFMDIFSHAASGNIVIPPMRVPIEGLKYAQVGASVGMKLNPFYKVMTRHDGIDLVVGQGTPVLAAGDGVVTDVKRSVKGLGNVVEITHEGGYVTVYAHLEDIVARKGERVKAGRKIGNVGISGNSFAPHLHYEIHKDSLILDPVNYFFASYGPEDYMRISYMAATTGQSMD